MILCERAPAIPKTTFSTENDMEIKVEESLMMPAVFHTVASRTQLAVVRSKHLFLMNCFEKHSSLVSREVRITQITLKNMCVCEFVCLCMI